MGHDVWVLALTAASAGFVHALLGPDHYLPFAALARAEGWTRLKTVRVTLLCGAGHLAGAGFAAWAAVFAAGPWLQALRAGLASWLLMGLGIAYALWGLRQALRRPASRTLKAAPLMLLAIFILGPCEPLVPTLMLSKGDPGLLLLTACAFSAATLVTMLGAVLIAARIPLPGPSAGARHRHALAGAAIAACALAV